MNLKSERYKGIIAAIIASVLWSTGGIFIKLINWNPMAISGSRSLIAALILLVYIRRPKFTKSKPQIIGIIAYVSTVMFFVIANKLTTSANAILLQYTAPIFVAILGVLILKEKLHWYDLVTILVVFSGMLLFFIENVSAGNTLGNIIAIFSGFSFACVTISFTLQKEGSAIDTVIFGNILTFIIAIPFMLKGLPDLKSIFFIIILGTFQLGISYIFFVYATKYLKALEVILISVIEPLLNPVWVYIFVGESPGIYAILGGIIVIAAIVIRSTYISKKRSLENTI